MDDLQEAIAEATAAYYDQARGIGLTAVGFYDWLASLSAARRAVLLTKGFAQLPTERALLRFCLEQRGFRMWRFMAERLSSEAFLLWADGD